MNILVSPLFGPNFKCITTFYSRPPKHLTRTVVMESITTVLVKCLVKYGHPGNCWRRATTVF